MSDAPLFDKSVDDAPRRPRRAARRVADPDAASEPEEISGVVERIVYHSEESGYTVCLVRVSGSSDAATVVGKSAAVWEGEALRARGRWTRHRQHGVQFQADEITCLAPVNAAGIERYLGSGMIKGIGKVMAERLVQAFGDDTLRIIDKESKRLEEVEGIGPVRRDTIKQSWNEQRAVRDIMVFLQSHGVGVAQATRIYRTYGSDAVAVVSKNPYRLAQDIWGIGFATADKIAMNLGVEPESDIRARAGVVHVLQVMTDEGHCFSLYDDLATMGEKLLGIGIQILENAVDYGVTNGTLVCEGDRIYLSALHEAETSVADHVGRLMEGKSSFDPIVVDKAIPWAEGRMHVEFAPEQSDALQMAMREKVSIITGGPGVGKTTIMRALVDVFRRRGLRVLLAAPTGRAAKRMEETSGQPAKTIHRTLKFQPQTGQFEHGPGNPIEADVVIVDEVSMMDIQLTAQFLGAVPDSATLVLVGDIDQLPSIGPGNVLRDLLASHRVPSVRLTTIFRQQERSWIVHNAHRVNEGEFFELPEDGASADFYFVESDTPDDVIERMLSLVVDRVPKAFDLNTRRDIQVLTPMRRNQLGAVNLNAILQDRLNPKGPALERFGRRYREGDRVLQVRNNYDKNVFNGDIGVVSHVDLEEQELCVEYEGRPVPYELSELDELDLAYACSIHKSQGSEYPAVVILLTTQHYKLLQRNLLYTAITRGRKLACVIGSRKAVGIAIRNNEIRLRRTGLRERVEALPL